MKHSYAMAIAALLISGAAKAQTLLYEGFDDFPGILSNGWSQVNNSNPQGPTMWAQGDGGIGVDTGHSGDTTSYITDTFTATSASASGNISDWVISPPVTIDNGDSITIWTVSYNSSTYPDRVEVRISPNAGSDVGADDASVGDFTTLVVAVNPELNTTDYPAVVDGATWTRFGGEVTGLPGATSCRVAIRYYITDGGFTGSNGSSVGVDDLEVFRGTSNVGVHELSLADVHFAPNPASDRVRIQAATGTYDLNVYSVSGQRVGGERFTNSTVYNVAGLQAGVYVFELRDVRTGAVSRERIVKQ